MFHYHYLSEFSWGLPLGGRSDKNSDRLCALILNIACRTPCRLFIHDMFFGHLGHYLLILNKLGQSPPFRPMRALTLQCSWAFTLVCELWSAPNICLTWIFPMWLLYGSFLAIDFLMCAPLEKHMSWIHACGRVKKYSTSLLIILPSKSYTHSLYRTFWHESPLQNVPLKLHYSQDILQWLVLERVASYVNKE